MAKMFTFSASRSDEKSGINVRHISAWSKRHFAFLLTVVLPTLLAVIYYGFVASPQYVSQADFVVRGQTPQTPGLLAGILPTGGGAGGSEDTYAVQDYVVSRDAAQLLLKRDDLAHAFNIPEADALARFPNFYSGRTFEHFYHYYKKHVKAELDVTTGLSTLSVRTFDAATSQRIARALLTAAEDLVNKMNARQRENTIAASLRERDAAISRLQVLNTQIDAYRNQTGLLDPQRQSQPLLTDLAGLDTARMTTRVQLEQLRRSASSSPLIEVLTRRLHALDQEISRSSGKVTGNSNSFVPKISGYDDLIFQRQLLEREVTSANAALDTARIQADRQQLYLEEISQPNIPDYPVYPRRASDIAIVFVTMFGLYLIGMLLVAGAREHKSM